MTDFIVPRDNVNDESVIVRSLYANSGDYVNKGQLVLEVETSKTNIAIEAPEDGYILHKLESGVELKVGELMFSIEDKHSTPESTLPHSKSNFESSVKISNAAVARALELGVDIEKVSGDWLTVKEKFNLQKKKSRNKEFRIGRSFINKFNYRYHHKNSR
jgi:pyruvate/2-oxoglutarate dehydrogenase complex dihydrolipoamide acyltransferase (E2) component